MNEAVMIRKSSYWLDINNALGSVYKTLSLYGSTSAAMELVKK